MIEFKAWPKIPRLKKDMVVTEKIDGTNAAVIIEEVQGYALRYPELWTTGERVAEDLPGTEIPRGVAVTDAEGKIFMVGAQSRNNLITPEKDNAGFAAWAFANAAGLVRLLGPGHHYGEWWGQGIQRRYGMAEKKFSLFNVHRYSHLKGVFHQIDVVPHLYSGPFNVDVIDSWLETLRTTGSVAAPGFMNPEGVVIYHAGAGTTFKAFVEDTGPKGSNG